MDGAGFYILVVIRVLLDELGSIRLLTDIDTGLGILEGECQNVYGGGDGYGGHPLATASDTASQ